jgi:hypothetical protein
MSLFIHEIAECITDAYYPPGGDRYDKQWKHLNKPFVFQDTKSNSIIFADTLMLFNFANEFVQLKVPFILVSAECDYTIPYRSYFDKDYSAYNILDNPNLICWFSINVDYNHPKLKPIPIGLPKHIPFLIKEHKMMLWSLSFSIEKVRTFLSNYSENKVANFIKFNKDLIYSRMTTSNSTNSWHSFEDIRITAKNKLLQNGIRLSNELVPWEQYINEMVNYKFCLSLPGKGIDCYRTWEALSIGVIPIVIHSEHLVSLYQDLPVVIVKDVGQITPSFLHRQFAIISENIHMYKWEKLTNDYWIDYIKSSIISGL